MTGFSSRLATALLLAAACLAQTPLPQPAPQGNDVPAQLPFLLEMGGYDSHVTQGYGDWSGAQTTLWIRSNPIFIPAFFFDSQTRPTGTDQDYGFFSYLNWTKNFYTTQGFSVAPQKDPLAVYFPKYRYDVKANWKLPPSRNLILGLGYTGWDLGGQGSGQIFDVGTLWYHGKWIAEANLFVNRSTPGDLYSASGAVSVQYGREGKSWIGGTLGGGHQLYQYVGQVPFNVSLEGYNAKVFYRKWLTRHVGFMVSFEYQDLLQTYRRTGGAGSLFFEF